MALNTILSGSMEIKAKKSWHSYAQIARFQPLHMARTFKRKNRMDAFSGIDITPLIDLAFSMLIIFMISAPLLEQTIPINLPTQSSLPKNDTSDPQYQVISINAANQYHYGTERVSFQELSSRIELLSHQSNQPIIHLRADGQLQYQSVVNVIDLLERNGLEKLRLDTQVM
jgi:biopolymer transport protein ExbD